MSNTNKYADFIEAYVEKKTEQVEASGDYWGQTAYLDSGFDTTQYSKYAEEMD